MTEKSRRNHWQEALAFKQLLQMGSGRTRLARRGERIKLMDELEEERKQLQREREEFDDHSAKQKQSFDDRVRRLELIVKLCDQFQEQLMPDYVRLLKAEDETIDLLHRLRRVLGPKDLPPDLEHELRKREAEESGDTSARKAVFVEVLGEILHAALGKSADSEPAPSKPAKRRKPKSRIEDIEDAVRDAVAEHEPDPAA